MTQAELLKEVTKTIVQRFPPKRIVLFGSHVQGKAGPDSAWTSSSKWKVPSSLPNVQWRSARYSGCGAGGRWT
jgi:hypothetical protein